MAHHGGEHEWDLTNAEVKEAYYVRTQYSHPVPIPFAPLGPMPKRSRGTKASRASRD